METTQHPPLPAKSMLVVDERPGELTIDVPPRGLLRGSYGLFFFALAWLTITGAAMAGAIFAPQGLLAQGLPVLLGTLLFFSIFAIVGITALIVAIHLARRRVMISTSEDRLMVTHAGGLTGLKERQWSRAELSGVRVGQSSIQVNNRCLDELQILPVGGAKYGLLAGHSKADLEWLAARLASQLELAPPELQMLVLADVERPPQATRCLYQPLENGFTLSVPPAGVWRGSLAVFPIGVFYTLFVTAFLAAFAMFPLMGATPIAWVMTIANLPVGIGVMAFGYYLGTRQAEIAVANGQMLVIHRGLQANWKREWSRDELAAVRASESTIKSNNQPLMQLQIVPRAGKTVTLLTGRDRDELAWIATMIRKGLALPADEALQISESTRVAPTTR